ncbi:hypothetical protein C0V75_07190 [Tabrizicola sp. TH137]|uniref:SseB family protein n=1 Tax=Tabrizicola sp. TH137 TaxID=2067452 RepID=UPI000C7D2D31|nr:SseB family protein [Tabrizicola sp. TH137]PLL13186.1 hypothetical protein C0V75_07190 [Tabrizicola sp. TH137]
MTPLDAAHAAMERDGAEEADRLRFFDCLADGEFFLLLEEEAVGTDLKPRIFPLEDGPVVLVFDLEERMAEFTGGIAPYAALPGRVIAQVLAGQGVGLGVNLGVAPSQMMLPPEALDWLSGMLDDDPEEMEARPVGFHAPGVLPDRLVDAVLGKLARAGGLAAAAFAVGVRYEGGATGHLMAFIDAAPEAEAALARAIREALAFSGVEAGMIDVVFLKGDDPVAGQVARVGQRFDLPVQPRPERQAPAAPGSDPQRPPKLR